ncbi:Zn(II)2Cys6 transcription factor domain-containing protein [Aspergillus alliaceus]|uniref:Zn(II)2Cys6 transcription factor domain-containing protein n=1 Tax=Petromyces alliaceus TaxID=209559 RepID=UPI0012A54F45|nr:uncharacterized protein BDW43DRAFT_287987 [Aspergillus alliaceus]KAB8229617.1 hypothetical protein BDW43DRAFT_287987 [Aspergillus alliaceus]
MPYRRRQHHSCDQCRKGKRACDALLGDDAERTPTSSISTLVGEQFQDDWGLSCSNCKRYRRKCTFDWLLSHKASARRSTKKARNIAIATSLQATPRQAPSAHSGPNNHDSMRPTPHSIASRAPLMPAWDPLSQLPVGEESSQPRWLGKGGPACHPAVSPPLRAGMLGITSEEPRVVADSSSSWTGHDWEVPHENLFLDRSDIYCVGPSSDGTTGTPQIGIEDDNTESTLYVLPQTEPAASLMPPNRSFCLNSNHVANEYAQSTMTQTLMCIYNDSVENALSCWLTDRNCPYISLALAETIGRDRIPVSANRICRRVCQLDWAFSCVLGRSLTSAENGMASRALRATIMAFASQWIRDPSRGSCIRIPPTSPDHQSDIREMLWDQARYSLDEARALPSFRVAFANILFSLGQRPLDYAENRELGELMQHDPAPTYLEAALRQMFVFRRRLTRLQRQVPSRVLRPCRKDPEEYTGHVNEINSNSEACYTFNLLFWLGVMADTLTSVLYQRPLVISDEDSQIIYPPPASRTSAEQVDLDGWDIRPGKRITNEKSVWGNLFLHKRTSVYYCHQPRWPCSYEEAAGILSDAAPVKVLLFRRIGHLHTLVYRQAAAEDVEEAIRNAFLVYDYWNSTYKQFMLDCLAQHAHLPSRIQSWYVVLAAHWHLGAMMLADTVEDIDRTQLGLDIQAKSRHAMGVVPLLRRENAIAVGELATYSYDGQGFSRLRDFHESVNQAAFLTEPWTAVLIHSFTNAGTVLVREIGLSVPIPRGDGGLLKLAYNRCDNCIKALRCLGRMSDMALIAAKTLSSNLDQALSRLDHVNVHSLYTA